LCCTDFLLDRFLYMFSWEDCQYMNYMTKLRILLLLLKYNYMECYKMGIRSGCKI
jgi:hypothetical protein